LRKEVVVRVSGTISYWMWLWRFWRAIWALAQHLFRVVS